MQYSMLVLTHPTRTRERRNPYPAWNLLGPLKTTALTFLRTLLVVSLLSPAPSKLVLDSCGDELGL